MIKNIIFDMGNVLLKYTPNEYVKAVTDDLQVRETLLRELYGSPEWLMVDSGEISEQELVERVSARIPQHAALVRALLENWHMENDPVEGMDILVERLKAKGYKLFVLSNVGLKFHSFKDKVKAFEFMDGFVISAEEKVIKPNPDIFKRICDRYRLEPQECLFIDDVLGNVLSAKDMGMEGLIFRGRDEFEEYLKKSELL